MGRGYPALTGPGAVIMHKNLADFFGLTKLMNADIIGT